jgi:hypothetical protein
MSKYNPACPADVRGFLVGYNASVNAAAKGGRMKAVKNFFFPASAAKNFFFGAPAIAEMLRARRASSDTAAMVAAAVAKATVAEGARKDAEHSAALADLTTALADVKQLKLKELKLTQQATDDAKQIADLQNVADLALHVGKHAHDVLRETLVRLGKAVNDMPEASHHRPVKRGRDE